MRTEAEVREQLAAYQTCLDSIIAKQPKAPVNLLQNRIADLSWVLATPNPSGKDYTGTAGAGRLLELFETVVVNAGRWGKVVDIDFHDNVATGYYVLLDSGETIQIAPSAITPTSNP